jgi:hypothetical protein
MVGLGLDPAWVGCVIGPVLLSSVLFIIVPSVCMCAKRHLVCCV